MNYLDITTNTWNDGQPPKWALKLWLILGAVGSLEIARIIIRIAGEMLSTS